MKAILQLIGDQTLGGLLKSALSGEEEAYHTFQAAVAFVKRSGIQHIRDALQTFVKQGGCVRMAVGIDHQGTSFEGLSDLLAAIRGKGEVFVNHDEGWYTFHPKLYLFEGETSALLVVGSGNLTEGGLYTNDEASLAYVLNLSNAGDKTLLDQTKAALDTWCDKESNTVHRLDEAFLQSLLNSGYVRTEAEARKEKEAEAKAADREKRQTSGRSIVGRKPLFGRKVNRRRPPRRRVTTPAKPTEEITAAAGKPCGFVMTLMRTDVGVGQTTPGTSRRSPEIFVPLAARNRCPKFWGWPDAFTEDSSKPGKFDRRNVQVRIGGEIVGVNMMTWPVKHDFRLRSETLRSAGQVGDILRIERVGKGLGFVYYVEIIPQETSEYEDYLALCVNSTWNSERKWGYYD